MKILLRRKGPTLWLGVPWEIPTTRGWEDGLNWGMNTFQANTES